MSGAFADVGVGVAVTVFILANDSLCSRIAFVGLRPDEGDAVPAGAALWAPRLLDALRRRAAHGYPPLEELEVRECPGFSAEPFTVYAYTVLVVVDGEEDHAASPHLATIVQMVWDDLATLES